LTTAGHLLGGRVVYRQFEGGFRSGIEPVLLAASIPARSGDRVLEAGTGAGAALLCLSLRVPGVRATGVEIDEATARLAAANARANGFSGVDIVSGCIETTSFEHRFDHAIANPPYHAASGTPSPVAPREAAKRGSVALINVWIERLSEALRDHGTLTLVVPAMTIPACLAAMAARGCPCTVVFPLWPKAGRKAKLVLLRGVKNTGRPTQLAAGLLLHNTDGSFTQAAEAVLRNGSPLDLDA
jgi:tRNA1(Val) A37 N6-methylase TrmN6